MFHWTTEGEIPKFGINLSITKRDFRLIYIWITIPLEIKEYYFRFRFFLSPHIIYNKKSTTLKEIVNSYLWERDLIAKTREEVEDEKM